MKKQITITLSFDEDPATPELQVTPTVKAPESVSSKNSANDSELLAEAYRACGGTSGFVAQVRSDPQPLFGTAKAYLECVDEQGNRQRMTFESIFDLASFTSAVEAVAQDPKVLAELGVSL